MDKTCSQSLVEYSMFIAVVLVVFMGMRTYAQRGLQAHVKKTADQLVPHDEAAAVYTEEQAKWLSQIKPENLQGTTTLRSASKEQVKDNVYKNAKGSYSLNKFHGTTVNQIMEQRTRDVYDNFYDRSHALDVPTLSKDAAYYLCEQNAAWQQRSCENRQPSRTGGGMMGGYSLPTSDDKDCDAAYDAAVAVCVAARTATGS
jgi:hypothetical protein